MDVPTAVREKFVQIAPKSFDELKMIKIRPPRKKIVLWDYQVKAVKNWFDNNKKGIFEMATATGKTFAALACAQELKKEHKSLAIVIVCPYQHLIFDPWENVSESLDLKICCLFLVDLERGKTR
jgi:superfamily II DNA or RNA helicase